MKGARGTGQQHGPQAIEAKRPEMSLLDLQPEQSVTIAMCRQRVELARAPVVTIAVG